MDTPLSSGNPAAAPNSGSPFPTLKQHLRNQELTHIQRALECSGGDKKKAARLLGISLATLYRKLEGEHPGL